MNNVINKIKYHLEKRKKRKLIKAHTPFVAKSLESILSKYFIEKIPILIVSYNNGVYVDNFCRQLQKYNHKPIVIDNASTDTETIDTLNQLNDIGAAYVIKSKANFGHLVGFKNEIYKKLPEIFAYSDPDLSLNPNLPENFIEVLADLTNKYNVYKAGFALTVEIDEPLYDKEFVFAQEEPFNFSKAFKILEWEQRFWRFKISEEPLEIYAATIDTTFAVYRKSKFLGNFEDAVRVAGDYSALHLPWFENLDLFNEETKEKYLSGNISSTWL